MPVLQYSIPSAVYITLVERGRKLGLSEHQVAKHLMLLNITDATDEQILDSIRGAKREQMKAKTRARPL